MDTYYVKEMLAKIFGVVVLILIILLAIVLILAISHEILKTTETKHELTFEPVDSNCTSLLKTVFETPNGDKFYMEFKKDGWDGKVIRWAIIVSYDGSIREKTYNALYKIPEVKKTWFDHKSEDTRLFLFFRKPEEQSVFEEYDYDSVACKAYNIIMQYE